jgi:hypothetical protein
MIWSYVTEQRTFIVKTVLNFTVLQVKEIDSQRLKKCENSFLFSALQYPKEHRFFIRSQFLSACPAGKSNIKIEMSVKHWWNCIDKGK